MRQLAGHCALQRPCRISRSCLFAADPRHGSHWRGARRAQTCPPCAALLDVAATATTTVAAAAADLVPIAAAAPAAAQPELLALAAAVDTASLAPLLAPPLVQLQLQLPVDQLSAAGLYELVDRMDALVAQQLTGLTPLSFGIVLGAGLLTSLSPCTLSVLPLTIGYIGGYGGSSSSNNGDGSGGSGGGGTGTSLVARAGAFSAGLATTLAALGVAASFLGGTYGQIGDALPVGVSLVAIAMGLNLLEVLPLRLPSLDVDVRQLGLPPLVQAYLAGLTFALAASPCSTPILATLLAYVSTTRDAVTGGALLFAYTLGYVAPLLAAAVFTGALTRILAVRRWSSWVTPASGVLLLAGGTYALLTRVAPA